MNIERLRFSELNTIQSLAFVITGAGEPLGDWPPGIGQMLIDAKIVEGVTADEVFSRAIYITDNLLGSDGRNDLVLVFNPAAKPNVGRLAMWRIRVGDISWLEDFLVNYRQDYR